MPQDFSLHVLRDSLVLALCSGLQDESLVCFPSFLKTPYSFALDLFPFCYKVVGFFQSALSSFNFELTPLTLICFLMMQS